MQKNINVKNVKEYVKKVNIYMKNFKVTSNRNVNKETNKQNKEKVYKNNKHTEMRIKYVYKNMKIYNYIEMYVEKYLRENIESI